ncbi:branched-chain amino acid ABC transporter permease [Streptomyces sp. JJ36]|uniref:branched-chain amino acid ABC transporter permease n=1 Tax=Streptomyces sp. JJ36 TaxID=2736645 RepID=UPI001F3F9555|nr:branched-chain amino acid ABC transporter permease [Streptomyces sp. JJ36]MCF6522626.1 branched-chain amino acid ABC transporter permease [Streptomyces sp. JJ36]
MTSFLQQLFNGLVSGSFYALLALGLSVIFGMLRVVNFAHGAIYTLGAFGAVVLADVAGLGFWWALVLIPLALVLAGALLERLLIHRLMALDPLYNFLLTFGIALVCQDLLRMRYGSHSQPYEHAPFTGMLDFGLFDFPTYQVFALGLSLAVCTGVWLLLTRTRIGTIVRASTERPELTRAFGIDTARWVTPVFGFGVGLAGLAGVLATPMRAVNSAMGADLIVTVFAVVVIGGLGSVFGSVLAGFLIGMLQALGSLYLPTLSQTLVFLLMAVVLLVRPAGLFGKEETA